MSDQRCSDSDESNRIPSFIEPRPPLINNPFMRPKPQKGINLLDLFEEDSESEEPEWVQVYLRLKPCSEQNNLYEVKSDRCLITSVDTATAGHGRRTQHQISKMYTFSHIFGPESSQKHIFEHVVKDNLKKLPEGHSFTLLTYGASGSGKTYTLMGTVASPGLVPRSLEYVFRVVDAAQQPLYKPSDGGADKLRITEQQHELQWVKQLRQVSAPARDKYRRMSSHLHTDLASSTLDLASRTKHYVWVSFVEIYNEGIYDLLSNNDRSKSTSKLRIREDANGNIYVKGAAQAFVRSGAEAYDVMVVGKHSLQVAATGVHARSSRSHCIFTITMLTQTEDGGVRSSCVRLCDLAGSERARHTRNTGARMQESRAINSSLHVLERCLHMLRRKQRQPLDHTLVPYRESKLTRLLGAGLCGGRAGRAGAGGATESVAMVVTLNPAPQYAHETRHVLQLAAVAKDIQVNNTLAECESALESSASQDLTMEWSAELVRLRADNERLHFELVQAHSRIAEQRAAMEAKQRQVAAIMSEMVEEAKDMTRQYYESQLDSLRAHMAEMKQEYENKLAASAQGGEGGEVGTPSRSLQKKVAQLQIKIAILEENIIAERLARVRVEEEVEHLRACVDERDEKAQSYASADDDESDVSDSDSGENESANESLEPTFRKEDVNRSRILRRSLIDDNADTLHRKTTDMDCVIIPQGIDTIELDSDTDDSMVDITRETLKDHDSLNDTKDSTCVTGDSKTGESNKLGETCDDTNNDTCSTDINIIESNSYRQNLLRGTYCVNTKPPLRGTYFVATENVCNSSSINVSEDKQATFQESGNCDEDSDKINISVSNIILKTSEKETLNKISNISGKSNLESDISLAQFEHLEKFAEKVQPTVNLNTTAGFTNIQNLKEKTIYFEDNPKTYTNVQVGKINNENKSYFDNKNVGNSGAFTKITRNLNPITDRSPSIVKDDIRNDFEPNKIKKLLGQSFTKQSTTIPSSQKATVLPKKDISVDIFDGFDSPNILKARSASLLSERADICNDNSQVVNIVKHVPTMEVTDKVVTIDARFEKLHIDINTEHNVITTELMKSTLKKSIFDIVIEKHNQAKGEINGPNPGVKNIASDRKSDSKILTDMTQEPPAMLKAPSNEDQLANSDDDTQAREQISHKENNTIDEFDNIYKDITEPRVTEFELLVSQEVSSGNIIENNTETEAIDLGKTKYNLRHTSNTSVDNKDVEKNISKVVESRAKVEMKPPKMNLRLRRRKNQAEDKSSDQDKECTKLKDIVNLQKEFSDVTLDVPAPRKEVTDIASPKKVVGEENQSPLQGFLSCPSKSVTRSRRKLFTPRAEPLDEPASALAGGSGDSLERVHVPRPSYHRGRARRRL